MAPQAGHATGLGMEKPLTWQTRRPVKRCSTSQDEACGLIMRWPQARQMVKGA